MQSHLNRKSAIPSHIPEAESDPVPLNCMRRRVLYNIGTHCYYYYYFLAEICRDKNNVSSECFSEAQEFVLSELTP